MTQKARRVRWLDGVDYSLKELAIKLDMETETLRQRLRNRWSLDRIAKTPAPSRKPVPRDLPLPRVRQRGKPISRATRDLIETEQRLDAAVARECAPPWERHPQPWD